MASQHDEFVDHDLQILRNFEGDRGKDGTIFCLCCLLKNGREEQTNPVELAEENVSSVSSEEESQQKEKKELKSLDPSVEREMEVTKLRVAMIEKWIDHKKFEQLLDMDQDGLVEYNDFYDTLSQFGLTKTINLSKVWATVDKNSIGIVGVEHLREILEAKDEDIKQGGHRDDAKLPAFPKTLLVALVAHNNMKPSMMNFVNKNLEFFKRAELVTTGSTGRSLESLGLTVKSLVASGPLGGDQEIGGMIAKGDVGAVFFFQDPLTAHPHKHDIRALHRVCVVHDTMFASNPSTAQALIYSLEFSAFGYSHLLGMNPKQKSESKLIEKYKSNQTKVIAEVSRANIGMKERASFVLRGKTSLKRGSVIKAPTEWIDDDDKIDDSDVSSC
mmetsp:Transcript_13497/g.15183  ORF Transcript_13497/g.15183 Transcript_13497/m.15183 type:complete len:387 (+) Transcript_13497:139-1299(+)